MADQPTCPRCGSELPARAPRGLCPRCLLCAGVDGEALSLSHAGEVGATVDLSGPRSVLESLAASVGTVPRVLLRDTELGTEPPVVRAPDRAADPSVRYRIDGEIARGGMGEVLKGRDPDLGRDVAVKVLREDLSDRPEMVRRFVEEAQIGGQLQHPGIVPVYELGTFADRRPFFSMKLVKGQTLAQILAARPSPSDGLPRFLGIFEQLAQTVAYAHARGVIHRDLKPSNVMVGSFGEVQVMDWGLAKVLPCGGLADDAAAGKVPEQETVIATARSGSDSDSELSQAGSVMGTPSYMAPEQARGEVDRIDERADVFALGSILCEVLTGQPAFTGRSSGEIQRKAARADTADALARLDACAADAELVALARACLAAEPADRPRVAGAVSGQITAHLAGVQERLRVAEIDRARAEAHAVEERRRRRLQLGLAASVVALLVVVGSAAGFVFQQRAARAAVVARSFGEASSLREAALAHADDPDRWRAAREAARRVEIALGTTGDPAARRRLDALVNEVEAGERAARGDQELLARAADIRSAKADDFGGRATEAAYAAAFREAGLDLAALPPAEVGAKIRARPPAVATALAATLDAWAAVRRSGGRDKAGAKRIEDAAKAADPDPWRCALRSTLEQDDRGARLASLKTLARTAKFDELGPISLDLLGGALSNNGDSATAETVLRAAQRRHPGDVWVNHDLAQVLELSGRTDDAIRFYTAARSIRPETAHELAHALETKGEADEAVAVFRDLARLRPKDGRHLGCLGSLLAGLGRKEEAAKALDAAVAAHREAIRLRPDDAHAYGLMGLALMGQGKLDEAAEAYREAIRLQPGRSTSHDSYGRVLDAQGKLEESIVEYREAIRLEPENAASHQNLCVPLAKLGRLAEAEAICRRAIELRGDDARSYLNLGHILKLQRKYPDAEAAYRRSVRLRPGYADGYNAIGQVLTLRGDIAGGLAEYRRALKLAPPGSGTASFILNGIRANEAQLDRFARLSGILKGDLFPATASEMVTFAELCRDLGMMSRRQWKAASATPAGFDVIRPSPDRQGTDPCPSHPGPP